MTNSAGPASWKPDERAFERVLIIMFENQYREYVRENSYMRRLATLGIDLRNSLGVMHPSQTNYIASIAGCLCNVTSDDQLAPIDQRTVVDLLEEAPGSLDWRGYMESFDPSAQPWTETLTPADAFPYVIKHNPFSSFTNIVRDRERWSKLSNEVGFFQDVEQGTLPEYSWFTPNMWSDGHYLHGTHVESVPRAPQLVDQLAAWLEAFFERLRFPGPDSLLPTGTLVVVTFDEADFEAHYLHKQASPYDGPNQIYTVLLGDHLEPCVQHEAYNHYSLLRTVELNFDLGDLGRNDTYANPMQFLWNRSFAWAEPKVIGLDIAAGPIATAFRGDTLHVAVAADKHLSLYTQDSHGSWSPPVIVPIDGRSGIAMIAMEDQLVLAAAALDGHVDVATSGANGIWQLETNTDFANAGRAVALTAIDGGDELLLVCCGEDGTVASRVRSSGSWAPHEPIEVLADIEDIALGRLGSSLYLIAQPRDGSASKVVSYNTADFNVVDVATNPYGGPQDNTTMHRWSPSAFPVAPFSAKPDSTGQRQPFVESFPIASPMAIETLDGVLHLVHADREAGLASGTFSVAGLMTPLNPISQDSDNAATANNGFGTLAEAGWTEPRPLPNFEGLRVTALDAASTVDRLVVVATVEDGSCMSVVGKFATTDSPNRKIGKR